MNTELLNNIADRAAKTKPLGATLKFNFGEQVVYIDGTGDENVVSTDDKEADCVVTVSPADFAAVVKGELNPMMAFMTGKIKVKGDMGVAMKLQSLLG